MKILNYGSLNIDYVYQVDHILQGGETISSKDLQVYPGGKGLNQSVAMAKAGLAVYHGGKIGQEGAILLDTCKSAGIDMTYLRVVPERSGHTIIQVDSNGQNCILLFGGSNQMQKKEEISQILNDFQKGDWLILQNEVNELPYLIECAYEKEMNIVLNPSPFDEKIGECDLSKVSYFLINEIEGEQMTSEREPKKIIQKLLELYPKCHVVLTLGEKGAVYADRENQYEQPCFPVKVVDTTGAGDTFAGYFLEGIINKKSVPQALEQASKAASIAVSRKGASTAIPVMEEVEKFTESSQKN